MVARVTYLLMALLGASLYYNWRLVRSRRRAVEDRDLLVESLDVTDVAAWLQGRGWVVRYEWTDPVKRDKLPVPECYTWTVGGEAGHTFKDAFEKAVAVWRARHNPTLINSGL